jgi:hypothetical protein
VRETKGVAPLFHGCGTRSAPFGVVKKRSEILRSLVPTFFGLLFGVAIGVSFMKFGIVPDTGVVFNQEVQHQKQLDATRNAVTCPGAQPLGTESLPRDILATLSDLYPRRLWGKPEEVLFLYDIYCTTHSA